MSNRIGPSTCFEDTLLSKKEVNPWREAYILSKQKMYERIAKNMPDAIFYIKEIYNNKNGWSDIFGNWKSEKCD